MPFSAKALTRRSVVSWACAARGGEKAGERQGGGEGGAAGSLHGDSSCGHSDAEEGLCGRPPGSPPRRFQAWRRGRRLSGPAARAGRRDAPSSLSASRRRARCASPARGPGISTGPMPSPAGTSSWFMRAWRVASLTSARAICVPVSATYGEPSPAGTSWPWARAWSVSSRTWRWESVEAPARRRERLGRFAGRLELAVGPRLEDAGLDFGAARAAGRIGGERAAGAGRQGRGEDREREGVASGSLRFLDDDGGGGCPETFSGSDNQYGRCRQFRKAAPSCRVIGAAGSE